MPRKTLIGLAVGTAFALGAAADAAAETFTIDPTHSNIVFVVNHLGYSNMVGQFQAFSGEFTFDPDSIDAAAVEVTIQSDSVDTDHEARDEHLRGPDFFNAAEFPEMTFTSTAIERTGEATGTITGDFTLLGVTRPVTLDVTFNKMAPHPLPQYNGVLVAGFSAQSTLKRSDWGMSTFTPNLGDEITFWIEIEGHLKP